jgi:FolB domain-containing protein
MPHTPRSTPRDIIAIERLTVDCVVGLYPHERDVPQPLELDVYLTLDTGPAGRTERLRLSIDYAATANQLAFLLQTCRFKMLETAAHALSQYLLAPPLPDDERVPVTEVRLRLSKPRAFAGKGVPSVEITRGADALELARETKKFGTVDILALTRGEGIYRLNLAPGASIPMHEHRVMNESELVLSDGLLLNGQPVQAGSARRWPHGTPHRYDNPTAHWRSILCVDSPPFIPSDEIEVDAPAGQVEPEPSFLPLVRVE